ANAASVTLRDAGGAVAGALDFPSPSQLLTFTPAASLAVSTDYTVRLDGLRDLSGNSLPVFTSTFRTSSAATADRTGPSVSTYVPANGATGVGLTPAVSVAFNEAVSATTVNAENISVTLDGVTGRLAAVVTFDPATNTAAVALGQPLLPQRIYRIRVNGVRDVAGNVGSGLSTFTTGAGAAEGTAPAVLQ